MTLSDTCTPRREALTQGGEEKGSYSYHTHARHTCVHTHSARAHTCMHTVLMCTRIRPRAQTHMTKSRSGEVLQEDGTDGARGDLGQRSPGEGAGPEGLERPSCSWRSAWAKREFGGCWPPSELVFRSCVPVS